jgi:hypothetical protein
MERPYSMARLVRRCYTMVPFYRKLDFISMLLSRVPGRELRDEKNLGLCFIGRICQRRCFRVVHLLNAPLGVCSDLIFRVKTRDPPLCGFIRQQRRLRLGPFLQTLLLKNHSCGPHVIKGWFGVAVHSRSRILFFSLLNLAACILDVLASFSYHQCSLKDWL